MDDLDLIDNIEKPLIYEKEDMKKIFQDMSMVTDDPLGLGGILSDATRITQLINNGYDLFELFETILDSAIVGIRSYISSNSTELSANYRLIFRELGFSIGINGLVIIKDLIGKNPKFSRKSLENRFRVLDFLCFGKLLEGCFSGIALRCDESC